MKRLSGRKVVSRFGGEKCERYLRRSSQNGEEQEQADRLGFALKLSNEQFQGKEPYRGKPRAIETASGETGSKR